MSRSIAEVQQGAEVGANYRAMAVSIQEDERLDGLPLTRRRIVVRLKRAALAEELCPESPDPPACSVCGRTRSCLAVG